MNEYYNNESLSQSKLKLLLGSPRKFIETKESDLFFEEKQYFIIGNGVDCLITRGVDDFNQEFYISSLKNKPSDIIKSIINEVYSKVKDKNFTDCKDEILESCNNHNYQVNWKSQTRINRILENYEYWDELRSSEGKTILTPEDYELIKKIVDSFYNSPSTKVLFNTNNLYLQTQYQLPIYFKWEDIDCKSLLDMVIFDHLNREVYIFDIKTFGDRVINFNKSVEKNNYQIQCAFYWKAMEEYLIQNKMFDYSVKSFSFLVESTTDISGAVIYETTESFRAKGLYGEKSEFKHKKGILELLDDYKYYVQNGFEIEKEIKENNYKLTLK